MWTLIFDRYYLLVVFVKLRYPADAILAITVFVLFILPQSILIHHLRCFVIDNFFIATLEEWTWVVILEILIGYRSIFVLNDGWKGFTSNVGLLQLSFCIADWISI